jgi:hypothetical protein
MIPILIPKPDSKDKWWEKLIKCVVIPLVFIFIFLAMALSGGCTSGLERQLALERKQLETCEAEAQNHKYMADYYKKKYDELVAEYEVGTDIEYEKEWLRREVKMLKSYDWVDRKGRKHHHEGTIEFLQKQVQKLRMEQRFNHPFQPFKEQQGDGTWKSLYTRVEYIEHVELGVINYKAQLVRYEKALAELEGAQQ